MPTGCWPNVLSSANISCVSFHTIFGHSFDKLYETTKLSKVIQQVSLKYSREQSEKPVWNDELKWVLSFDCYNANAKIKTLNSTTFYCQFLRISNLVQKTKILKIKYFSPDNNFEHPQKKQTIVWCTH